jgi:SAM-dependent methyltransferase
MPNILTLQDIAAANSSIYNALWSKSYLARPERFNTWPLISELLPAAPDRLEIGPGLRPRLPIEGTHFIDISTAAIEQLRAYGGTALPGQISELPFNDQQFDLVCAFDVIEHVAEDRQAFSELSRVLKDGGRMIISVPLHAHRWTEFDEWSGHARRYDPAVLLAILADNQLVPEKSAVFGMQPSNPVLLKFGMWCLKHSRQAAMFFYNRLFMPLGVYFQSRLNIVNGLMDTTGVDEIVLVCRREVRPKSAGHL